MGSEIEYKIKQTKTQSLHVQIRKWRIEGEKQEKIKELSLGIPHVMYGKGNTVNNIVVTVYGDSWYLHWSEWTFQHV